MSKGLKGFLVGLVVLVAGFLIITTGLCIKNKTNPIDEWKSWLPQQSVEEEVETETEEDLENSDGTLSDFGEEATPVE